MMLRLAILLGVMACGGRTDPPPAGSGSATTTPPGHTEILERLDRLERKLDALAAPRDAGVADAVAVAPVDAAPAIAQPRPKPSNGSDGRDPLGGGRNDLQPFPGGGGSGSALLDCTKSIKNPRDAKCRRQYCLANPNDVRCELLE